MFRQTLCVDKHICWEELVALEPRLNDLMVEVRAIKSDANGRFCRDLWATGGWEDKLSLKKRIYPLVGWGSPQRGTILATEQAWHVVLNTLLYALPLCSGCGCVREDGTFV